MKTILFLIAGLSLFGQAPSLPIPTDATLLQAMNDASSALNGPISTTAMLIPIPAADLNKFASYMHITIDPAGRHERVAVCGKSGSNLVVCPGGRGVEGTQKYSYTSGTPISGAPTAGYFAAITSYLKTLGVALGPNLSNIPVLAGPITPGSYLKVGSDGRIVGDSGSGGGSGSSSGLTWSQLSSTTWSQLH